MKKVSLVAVLIGSWALGTVPPARAGDAEAECRTVVEALRKEAAAGNKADPRLADTLRQLTRVLQAADKVTEAEAALREAVRVRQTLAEAARKDPTARREFNAARRELGLLLGQEWKFTEAETVVRETLQAARQLATECPDDPACRRDAARASAALVAVLKWECRYQDAEACCRDAVTAWEGVCAGKASGDDFRSCVECYCLRAELLMDLGLHKDSETVLRQAISVAERLLKAEPAEPANRERLAMCHNQLGLVLREGGRWMESEAAYREAVAQMGRVADERVQEPRYRRAQARLQRNLAVLYSAARRFDESAAATRKAERFERLAPPESHAESDRRAAELAETGLQVAGALGRFAERDLAGTSDGLDAARKRALDNNDVPLLRGRWLSWLQIRAGAEVEGQRFAEAGDLCLEGSQVAGKLAADFPAVPRHQLGLADAWVAFQIALLIQGKGPAAADAGRHGDAVFDKLEVDYPTTARFADLHLQARVRLVMALQQTGRSAEAEAKTREIAATLDRIAKRFPQAAQYRRQFASGPRPEAAMLRAAGRAAEADALILESVKRWQALAAEFPAVSDYRRELAESHLTRGLGLSDVGKFDEAAAALFEGVKIDAKLAGEFPSHLPYRSEYAKGCNMMAMVFTSRGDHAKAHEWYGRAITLLEANLAADPTRKSDRDSLCLALKQRGLTANRLQRFQDYDRDWARATDLALALDPPSIRLARAARNATEGHVDKALAEAEYLLRHEDLVGAEWLDLAAVFASCAGGPDEAAREARVKQALEALANAAAERYSDPARLKDDRRFDALRDRSEYIRLTGAQMK